MLKDICTDLEITKLQILQEVKLCYIFAWKVSTLHYIACLIVLDGKEFHFPHFFPTFDQALLIYFLTFH